MVRKETIAILEHVRKETSEQGRVPFLVNGFMMREVGKIEFHSADAELIERELAAILADMVDIKDRYERIADNAKRALDKIARRMADEAA